jgi:hypothetical protein
MPGSWAGRLSRSWQLQWPGCRKQLEFGLQIHVVQLVDQLVSIEFGLGYRVGSIAEFYHLTESVEIGPPFRTDQARNRGSN